MDKVLKILLLFVLASCSSLNKRDEIKSACENYDRRLKNKYFTTLKADSEINEAETLYAFKPNLSPVKYFDEIFKNRAVTVQARLSNYKNYLTNISDPSVKGLEKWNYENRECGTMEIFDFNKAAINSAAKLRGIDRTDFIKSFMNYAKLNSRANSTLISTMILFHEVMHLSVRVLKTKLKEEIATFLEFESRYMPILKLPKNMKLSQKEWEQYHRRSDHREYQIYLEYKALLNNALRKIEVSEI